jgi:glycosyltransferase involved in cell wall biosynthesis
VALLALLRLMRRFRPHVVHTHTAKAGTLGRLAARLAGVPVVVHTYHGHVFHGYFSPRKSRIFLAIERMLARWTDRLLTVSDEVRAELLALGIGSPERLTVVPLGLDLHRFVECGARRGELRRELGVEGSVPLVGIVARLAPVKAHEVFLQAARSVSDRVPGVQFLVVGDGERRGALEAMARGLGLRDRVRFLGWRADLDRVYADLDLAVLCSRNEGSPVSLIEAMASGRAVVATRVGGVPDVVDDGVTGHLVAPGDPRGLADAMVGLLADPERRRAFGAAGRKRVCPAYGAERLLADVARLYAELLDAEGGPRRGPGRADRGPTSGIP